MFPQRYAESIASRATATSNEHPAKNRYILVQTAVEGLGGDYGLHRENQTRWRGFLLYIKREAPKPHETCRCEARRNIKCSRVPTVAYLLRCLLCRREQAAACTTPVAVSPPPAQVAPQRTFRGIIPAERTLNFRMLSRGGCDICATWRIPTHVRFRVHLREEK